MIKKKNNGMKTSENVLKQTMDQAFPGNNRFFAKTSLRSAKDACICKQDFFDIYKNELSKFSDPTQENARIITLLVMLKRQQ
jgi:hypothetical protein